VLVMPLLGILALSCANPGPQRVLSVLGYGAIPFSDTVSAGGVKPAASEPVS